MELYLGQDTKRLKLYIDLLPYERKSFIAVENNRIIKNDIIEEIYELLFYTRIEYLSSLKNSLITEFFYTDTNKFYMRHKNKFDAFTKEHFIELLKRAIKNIKERKYTVNKWIYFYDKEFKTMNEYIQKRIKSIWWDNWSYIIEELEKING